MKGKLEDQSGDDQSVLVLGQAQVAISLTE
jgi:hypothetical protein